MSSIYAKLNMFYPHSHSTLSPRNSHKYIGFFFFFLSKKEFARKIWKWPDSNEPIGLNWSPEPAAVVDDGRITIFPVKKLFIDGEKKNQKNQSKFSSKTRKRLFFSNENFTIVIIIKNRWPYIHRAIAGDLSFSSDRPIRLAMPAYVMHRRCCI